MWFVFIHMKCQIERNSHQAARQTETATRHSQRGNSNKVGNHNDEQKKRQPHTHTHTRVFKRGNSLFQMCVQYGVQWSNPPHSTVQTIRIWITHTHTQIHISFSDNDGKVLQFSYVMQIVTEYNTDYWLMNGSVVDSQSVSGQNCNESKNSNVCGKVRKLLSKSLSIILIFFIKNMIFLK